MGRQMYVLLCRAAVPFLAMASLCSFCLAQGTPVKRRQPITLWVREVNGKALYWVGERPAARHPLTTLEQVLGPNIDVELSVVLYSNVPINEMFEIDGVLDKIPITHVRYYVYDPAYPRAGMTEIVWRTKSVPLPGAPPPVPK